MNRRESLKFIGVGSVTAGMILGACGPDAPKEGVEHLPAVPEDGRQPFEIERDRQLLGERFFTDHELTTFALLADIIIPADDKSGSASAAGVPEFIEFVVKDMPSHQVPLRGGLRWLDTECLRRFEKPFAECSPSQRIQMVEDIAYPKNVKPGMEAGAAFFNRMRDLTATGFFTSEMGVADLGYMGNRPGTYQGVPKDVLQQFGLEEDDW